MTNNNEGVMKRGFKINGEDTYLICITLLHCIFMMGQTYGIAIGIHFLIQNALKPMNQIQWSQFLFWLFLSLINILLAFSQSLVTLPLLTQAYRRILCVISTKCASSKVCVEVEEAHDHQQITKASSAPTIIGIKVET
ncbi:uncharacterized protein G2W53_025919 [Senna tora]|uniref:Uncharacterized protein n=1 Tax=Senna tora TaxID=362788 RepID=A0A834TGD8_9FABA|nr:uncharacterized protein G2W53_025919 [Senna tora]